MIPLFKLGLMILRLQILCCFCGTTAPSFSSLTTQGQPSPPICQISGFVWDCANNPGEIPPFLVSLSHESAFSS